jgi:uroporphyrinogen decarboxylase
MAYTGVLQDVRKCISLQKPDRVPLFAISMDFDISYCGYNYLDYGSNLERMVEISLKINKEFDYDWVMLHPDDYIEFETLIKTEANAKFPSRPRRYVKPTLENIKNFKIPDFKNDLRMPIHLEALSRIKSVLKDTVCLTSRLSTPFDAAAFVFGITDTLMMTIENPNLLRRAMDFFLEMEAYWAKEVIRAGADALWISACQGSSKFISPKTFEDFAVQGAKDISDIIKKEGGISYFHGAESSKPHLEIAGGLGFDIINIGEGISIGQAKDLIGEKVCISGNLSPIKTLMNGTIEDVEEETKLIMLDGMKDGGYIFNTEENTPIQVPPENIKKMIEIARRYGIYD